MFPIKFQNFFTPMRDFTIFYNYFFNNNNLGSPGTSNENTLHDEFFNANCENNTVKEFEFKDDNFIEINSCGNVFEGYFEFENQLQFDFNRYQKVELFFMVFDNTKLTIQNYSDNYFELNELFNARKPPVDGILYLGRDSHDRSEIQDALHSDTIGITIKECNTYCPRIHGHCTLPWYKEKMYLNNSLDDEVTKLVTSQICYDYNANFLIDLRSGNYEKLRVDLLYIKLNGPIKGVNIESVKQKKISLVAGFRLTKKDTDVQEIHFTKNPLIFKYISEKDFSSTNAFYLEDKHCII